ncbi:MAG TPA: protein-L-isoaspartate O-methyltransferase, partial [Micavibrio sp.]
MPNLSARMTAARTNMVDSQIHTAGVISAPVLDAFRSVPREMFVPESLQGVAYADEDLNLGHGCFLMEPVVLARMIHEADIKVGDIVLNIGDSTGYASSILSVLASTVVTVETKPGMLDHARRVWAENGYCNIAMLSGDLTEGCPEHAPYSLIFMNGSVSEIPDIFLAQLSLRGRLVAVWKPAGAKIGTAVMIERIGDGKYATRKLFDAATPYIIGFEPRSEF